jgi:ABC-type glycerol-3-phosphate transport system substrate-binding protein
MKKTSLFKALLLVTVLTLLLASCAPAAPVAPEVVKETQIVKETSVVEVEKVVTATAVPPAADVTLTIWVTGGDFDAGLMQSAADLYTLVHPNVTFKIEPVSWSDAHTKFLAAASAQSGPDLITGGMSWGIELGKNGGMIDLKKQYPALVETIQAKTMPGIWGAIVPPSGEVFAPEWASTLMMAYYRTDIIEEKTGSKELPKTWEEFTALLEKLQAAGMQTPLIINWGSQSWLGYQNWLYAAGGSFYSADCSAVTLNTPEAEQALTYYIDFYTKYNTPKAWDTVPFEKGDAAIMVDGNWNIPTFDLTKPELAGKWSAGSLPAGPSGTPSHFIGGQIIGIMSYTAPEIQDVAADFIGFLYSDEAMKAQATYAAAQKSVFIPPSDVYVDLMPIKAEYKDAVKAALANAWGPPNCKGWEEGNPNIDKAIQEVLFKEGAVTPDDIKAALQKMQAGLEDTLSQ